MKGRHSKRKPETPFERLLKSLGFSRAKATPKHLYRGGHTSTKPLHAQRGAVATALSAPRRASATAKSFDSAPLSPAPGPDSYRTPPAEGRPTTA
jgi:hypothetical protein